MWGPFTIDLFTSSENKQVSWFYSLFQCPGSSGVDALLQPWVGHNGVAFPPFTTSMLLQVVQKVREEHASVTVVVPLWPAQSWFHELMLLAADTFQLPYWTLTGPMARPHSSWPLLAVRIKH
jgi:hypothetical protein